MIALILVGLMSALAGAIVYVRRRRYRAAFRIPARREDRIVCRGPHLTTPVAVDCRIQLPAAAVGPDKSAFLMLQLSATTAGHVLDPSIDVQYAGTSYRQYFERGVVGTRYLNLSPAIQHSAQDVPLTIGLSGHHVRWKADASLIVFESPAMGTGDMLVVAPHPDDSEIAAFGLYSQRSSWILTVTCGERSPTDLAPVVANADQRVKWLALLRVWDSLTVPQLGGVPRERCSNLVFPDSRLKQMHDNPGQTFQLGFEDGHTRQKLRKENPHPHSWDCGAEVSWTDLVEEFRRALDRVRPEIVVCPHPLIDPHYDHVFTGVALAEALCNSPHQPRLVLLYVVHANEVPLYPFGTADSVVSLPPWAQEEWAADSIFSHPLGEDTRSAKFFAVEAAHDLRTYSQSRTRTFRQLALSLRREIAAFIGGTGLLPTDYLRRAPRPNEIYYVVSVDGLRELAHRATQLDSARTRRNALAGR
jgi:LmbE family N-acetylglucosaminyl deacetylase